MLEALLRLTVTFTQGMQAKHMFYNENAFSAAPIYLRGLVKSQHLLFMVTVNFSSQFLYRYISLFTVIKCKARTFRHCLPVKCYNGVQMHEQLEQHCAKIIYCTCNVQVKHMLQDNRWDLLTNLAFMEKKKKRYLSTWLEVYELVLLGEGCGYVCSARHIVTAGKLCWN